MIWYCDLYVTGRLMLRVQDWCYTLSFRVAVTRQAAEFYILCADISLMNLADQIGDHCHSPVEMLPRLKHLVIHYMIQPVL